MSYITYVLGNDTRLLLLQVRQGHSFALMFLSRHSSEALTHTSLVEATPIKESFHGNCLRHEEARTAAELHF